MKNPLRVEWQRPRSLHAVVRWSETPEDIGYHLADFLDHVNLMKADPRRRQRIRAAIRTEPPSTGNAVQDAYLAAVAAHLAGAMRMPAPRWVAKPGRRAPRPWFALPYPWARAELLRSSPAAFRERNLFTTEDALARA